jgi:hypothetical protein
MERLEDWDAAYLTAEIVGADETEQLEKKGEDAFQVTARGKVSGQTQAEIAKQVCAFANSGDGFLVFGIDKHKQLDAGVPSTVGNTPVQEWFEQAARNFLRPRFEGVRARFIQVPNHHSPGRGVLVVAVPLSESRPHHVTTHPEEAYLRGGAHSVPMRIQTLLDMAFRSSTAQGEVLRLGRLAGPNESSRPGFWHFTLNPVVRMTSGPICRHWAVEIRFPHQRALNIQGVPTNARELEPHVLSVEGTRPLYPGRPTRVCDTSLLIVVDHLGFDVTVALYMEAARPVEKTFNINRDD